MGVEKILGAVAGPVIGAVLGSDGASDAAAIQDRTTAQANAVSERQYNQTRADLAPARKYGNASMNKLASLLGLEGFEGAGGGGNRLAGAALVDTSSGIPRPNSELYSRNPEYKAAWDSIAALHGGAYSGGYTADSDSGWVEDLLTRTLQGSIDRDRAQAASDPSFGSLLKPFTGKDLQNEPGYQFGLREGQTALDRVAARGGSLFSGAAMKEAARYGQDYAGTKYGEAFNRDASQKRMTYDFLNGGASLGQNAAAMTGNAGAQMAGQVGANTTALGNAQGAARIAQGNSWGNALQNATNNYQQNEMMNKILGGNRGWSTGWGTAMNNGTAYG